MIIGYIVSACVDTQKCLNQVIANHVVARSDPRGKVGCMAGSGRGARPPLQTTACIRTVPMYCETAS